MFKTAIEKKKHVIKKCLFALLYLEYHPHYEDKANDTHFSKSITTFLISIKTELHVKYDYFSALLYAVFCCKEGRWFSS